jgi:hypothetical protein
MACRSRRGPGVSQRLKSDPNADASEAAPAETAGADPDAETGAGCKIRVAVTVRGRLGYDATGNAKRESQNAD